MTESTRRGKFTLDYNLLQDEDIAVLRYIMRDVIVYHIDNNYATNEITYWAYHPSFDTLSRGETIPEYECLYNHNPKWRRK